MKEIEKIKKPWPTKDAMEQVYTMKLWGENNSPFYSGIGSHHPDILDRYINEITSFLSSFQNPPVICDLGCGDFNVGKELVMLAQKYHAVDIVEPLIAYNSKKFNLKNLEFHCLNIAEDDLPNGDIVICRQVLQHLSNAEIKAILTKLKTFKFLILTEHIPEGNFKPNKDIISGQGTRLKKQSGVDILASPFNFKVKEEIKLFSVKSNHYKGIIETKIFKIQ